MSGDDQWGPWIEHDGCHLPPHGSFCQATFDDCVTLTGQVDHNDQTHRDSFLWSRSPDDLSHVVRYRVRKPRGLTVLEGLLENLPDRVSE